MTIDEIKKTLSRLENLMYGGNYEVGFGIYLYDNCFTIADFKIKVEADYKDTIIENSAPILYNMSDFWEDVNYGLTFRGDDNVGLVLTKIDEEKILEQQEIYKGFIKEFITNGTKVFCIPTRQGVFWNYAFLLISEDKCLFTYGFADD